MPEFRKPYRYVVRRGQLYIQLARRVRLYVTVARRGSEYWVATARGDRILLVGPFRTTVAAWAFVRQRNSEAGRHGTIWVPRSRRRKTKR